MLRLPQSLTEFAARQATIPVADLFDKEPLIRRLEYSGYWYRVVGAMLLSGRVAPRHDKQPNRTDLHRLGKEANFHPQYLQQYASLLIANDVVRPKQSGGYQPAENFQAFFSGDAEPLPRITRRGLMQLFQDAMTGTSSRLADVMGIGLDDFLMLFFAAFADRAVPQAALDRTLQGFSELPREDLLAAARSLGREPRVSSWPKWLDKRGREKCLSAVYVMQWAYICNRNKNDYTYASPTGLAMLGLGEFPPLDDLPIGIQIDKAGLVTAGCGLPVEDLATLVRHCKFIKSRECFEFKIEAKRLTQIAARDAAGEELVRILQPAGDLPPKVAAILRIEPVQVGALGIRLCSAVVRADSEGVLAAVRQHPKLKGYILPHSPPGLLLLKPESSPGNFYQRCKQLGFEISAF